MAASPGLATFLHHCVETLASEAASAIAWEELGLAPMDYREERARKLLAELSAWTVSSGAPRSFVENLPGVKGGLRPRGAYLVLRLVKIHLYVAGALGHDLERLPELESDNLFLLGLELGMPELERVITRKGSSADLLARAWPAGREEAVAALERELNRRVGHLESLPFPLAMEGAFEFLTLAAAVDLAAAWYDDLRLDREEVAGFRRLRADRAAAVLGLLRLTARADGSISGEEEGVLAAGREVVPMVDPEELMEAAARMSVERLPEILSSAEERYGLLHSMLAVASADGRLDPAEVRLCRDVGALLEVPADEVERLASAALPA